ncbi:MAG: hypothetical protein ACREVK_08055 [Gammaproteobacteria bacterium]
MTGALEDRGERCLLNHTTQIPLSRTLAEIAKAVPAPVTFEREHARVVALSFRYGGEFYRLAPNVEGVWALLNQAKGLGRGKRTYEHAERVAWRCVLSWVKAELALVAMDLAVPRTRPGFRKGSSAIEALVSVQKRAQLDWGERLE